MHGFCLFILQIFILTQFANCKSVLRHGSVYDAKEVIDFMVDTKQLNKVQSNVGDKWPMGNVLYYFDTKSYDQTAAKRIRMVMNVLEGSSCIKFTPILVLPTPEEAVTYLEISNPDKVRECVHMTNPQGLGAIRVTLGYDCLAKNDILHSLLHGLGFYDEVAHPKRDQYVRVLWDNINPKYRHLYRMTEGPSYGEYDPLSIMHFHDRAFSNNGQATLVPLIPGLLINPSDDLSPLDIMKLRVHFGRECNRRKVDNLLGACKNVLGKQNKYKLSNQKNQYQSSQENEIQYVKSHNSSDEANRSSAKGSDENLTEDLNNPEDKKNVSNSEAVIQQSEEVEEDLDETKNGVEGPEFKEANENSDNKDFGSDVPLENVDGLDASV